MRDSIILPHSHVIPVYRPRPQYPAESHGNGSAASATERSPPHRGLPSDPRPGHKIPSGLRPDSSSSIDARSPSPAAGHTRNADSLQYHMPVPDTSFSSPGSYPQPWNSSSAGRNYTDGLQSPTLQKKTSIRPPGAASPRIPGHTTALDSRDDPSITASSPGFNSPMSNASGSYFPRDATYASNFSNIPPPPPLNPPLHPQTLSPQTLPRPKNTLERDSSEDILAPGTHGLARPLSHSKFLIVFFRHLSDRRNHRSLLAVSSSEHPLRSTSTVSTSSSTRASGLERHLTASTVATTSTVPTTYSGNSSTTADRNSMDRGDSYSSKLHELSPGPVPLERQQSEPARSEMTARSRLASEIERLKNRGAIEDATNFYPDDDYYDDEDEFYSEEESLDSFVNFSLLSNIAVWLRDQVPRGTHVKGSIPYSRAFTGKDIVVCHVSLPVHATSDIPCLVPVVVYTPVTHRLGAPHEPRRHDQKSCHRIASSAQSTAATLFL